MCLAKQTPVRLLPLCSRGINADVVITATQGGGGISPTFGAGLWIVDYVMQAVLLGSEVCLLWPSGQGSS